MIGSETFIMVALRCSENSTPLARASVICSAMKAARRWRFITEASTISPNCTGTLSFSTVVTPSLRSSSIFRLPASSRIADCSLP